MLPNCLKKTCAIFFIQSGKTAINRDSIIHVFPPFRSASLHEITVRFDWFTGLYLIGQWFWFKILNWKLVKCQTNYCNYCYYYYN